MNDIELQVDAELQAWIEPLTDEELAGLEASLLEDGCRDPLVVWSGWLLDGHNRYALCKKHGIAFQTVEKTGLVTKADAKIWMIENQLGKRNTSDFGRVALALRLKPLIEQRAQERMLAGRAAPAADETATVDPVPNWAQGTGKTRDEVAKVAGVGHNTVRKVEQIIAKATPEVLAKVRTGELSINAAAMTVASQKPAELAVETAAKPASDELTELRVENGALRAQLDELMADFAQTLSDNELMGRVFDADDQVKASMEEARRQKALADNAERTLAARSQEFNERARNVVHWKNRAEKAEKQLKKAA